MTVEPLTLKQVQELLKPGIACRIFCWSGRPLVWVVEKERMQYVGIAFSQGRPSGTVKTLRESIFALGEQEKFNESSAFLYKQLIQPLLPHITEKS